MLHKLQENILQLARPGENKPISIPLVKSEWDRPVVSIFGIAGEEINSSASQFCCTHSSAVRTVRCSHSSAVRTVLLYALFECTRSSAVRKIRLHTQFYCTQSSSAHTVTHSSGAHTVLRRIRVHTQLHTVRVHTQFHWTQSSSAHTVLLYTHATYCYYLIAHT